MLSLITGSLLRRIEKRQALFLLRLVSLSCGVHPDPPSESLASQPALWILDSMFPRSRFRNQTRVSGMAVKALLLPELRSFRPAERNFSTESLVEIVNGATPIFSPLFLDPELLAMGKTAPENAQ
ncbi:uncharacterized protein LOC143684845 isoform X4 [Tamandua tetradactyla]|uniref:uncharacterized protein LOC143684845 isoform X4 n=1 Tax=Tamandua tetradactyla TaxID=48850 RepID=UPI004054085C